MTTLVAFRRVADGPRPERELLEVDEDNTARAWRSVGPAIGRFAGAVGDPASLRSAVEAARAAGAPGAPELPPDASVETVELGDETRARFVARRPVEGPWAPLVDACREALDALAASPVAAIALVIAADGSARLEHRGGEALAVELASLEGQVRRWVDGRPVAEARLVGAELDRVEAGPGWSLELAAEGFDPGNGIVAAEVSFVADDDGVYVPVRLTASLGG